MVSQRLPECEVLPNQLAQTTSARWTGIKLDTPLFLICYSRATREICRKSRHEKGKKEQREQQIRPAGPAHRSSFDLLLLSETSSLSTFLLSRYHVRLACLHCFSLSFFFFFEQAPAGLLAVF